MTSQRRLDAIEREGRALVERLGGRWTPAGGMCRCPAHDDRNPSLSVRAGASRLLFHCFAGCNSADVLRALRSDGLVEPGSRRIGEERMASSSAHSAAALRIWSEARAIAGTPAETYLAERGLQTSSAQLRFHPRTPHGRAPLTSYRPALIAAVRGPTGLLAVHRTFLDGPDGPGGKRPRKCGLGGFGNGAVRLGGSGSRLGLAEGVETALSATALFGLPCWATLGTERFGLVELPRQVTELLLFLDHDPGGRRAEALARKAFAHVGRIEVHYPPRPGDDWNDVLRAHARARA